MKINWLDPRVHISFGLVVFAIAMLDSLMNNAQSLDGLSPIGKSCVFILLLIIAFWCGMAIVGLYKAAKK